MKTWMTRILTPIGRIAILKLVILSNLTYLWFLLPNLPDYFINKLQFLIYAFVWNQKSDKISRNTSTKFIAKGGLGIPYVS